MRRSCTPLLIAFVALLSAGCDRRKADLHAGVEWATRMFERVNTGKGLEALTLASTLETGGDPIHWLSAHLPSQNALPCCDREPKPWRVTVTWTPEGLITISGYGDDLKQPLERTTVQLKTVQPPGR